MILVDSSVWIEHLRHDLHELRRVLLAGEVIAHPMVIGELAMGNLRLRETILGYLRDLPQAKVATDDETLDFISRERLHGLGIGYIDAHLIAATLLTRGARLWTLDRRLAELALRLGVAI